MVANALRTIIRTIIVLVFPSLTLGRILCKCVGDCKNLYGGFRVSGPKILPDLIRIASYGACMVEKMFLLGSTDDLPNVLFSQPFSSG